MTYHRPLAIACLLVAPLTPAQDKPLPPNEAPQRMTLPAGFRATLFAGEPDVVQPIAFAIDDRGRLWVAECYSYPKWQTDGKPGKDRILILEDRDGDGRFDSRKVFYDKVANISGLQLGFGGVWVCATPNLLFIPDRDGDDVPDGPPEIVLDGWSLKAQHNVFNSLTWGPDGWLYGCNGITDTSHVGRPATPDAERVALNCGVWRLHPVSRRFEVVANGTTNPWGLDFDDYGQMFITNCVIHHLWHVIPGAHYQRMFGQDFNPHWYSLMTSCADHIHWGGGSWQSSRGGQGSHAEAGGGHAHSGAMVYLGDNWPHRYRNGVFMCNIHGNRVNHDALEPRGSGYVARHAKDYLLANDPWFRGLALQYGHDGGVYVSDWTDTGECHNHVEVDRSNGRIYKVVYGTPSVRPTELAKLSDAELVRLQLHKNDWHVRHARRLLQERAVAGKLDANAHGELRRILSENPDTTRKLRALWALHVTGGLDGRQLLALLGHAQEHVRGWAVRLGLEDRKPSDHFLGRLAELAGADPSPVVRLALASGLQRLPLAQRWPIAERLAAHAEDAADANLPLMLWYGTEPFAAADSTRALALAAAAKVPLLREYTTRRVVHLGDRGLTQVVDALSRINEPAVQKDWLRGIEEALVGQRMLRMPAGWQATSNRLCDSPDANVRERTRALGVLFGDAGALSAMRQLASDHTVAAAARRNAVRALVYQKDAALVQLLHQLLSDPELRATAIRGLAAYDHADTPKVILAHYAALSDEEKSDAVQTLASRPAYALALLDAVGSGTVPRRDVSPFTARQLLGLKNTAVTNKLHTVWGVLRPASREKATLTARYKALLTPAALRRADASHGRQVYARTCAACHRLFDAGGDVGPDLTGSQRANLDYVLDNVLDPSAVVFSEYQVTVVETKDGRVLNGIVKQENDKAVTLQTQNEAVVIPKEDVETRSKSPLSLMPEGLFANLRDDEVRDLVAYLASPAQVPLPPSRATP